MVLEEELEQMYKRTFREGVESSMRHIQVMVRETIKNESNPGKSAEVVPVAECLDICKRTTKVIWCVMQNWMSQG